MDYNFTEIEKKWQKYWSENKTFKADNPGSKGADKPKFYVLDMFPYPSGEGLHVGHPLGYIASDVYARYKRLKGFNVLHPMGYDAFGLPAEQYAIETGQHPAITTQNNIKRYREQMDKLGFSFDWDREVRTCDPKYYKWTQWIFVQLFNSWYNNKTDKADPIETLISEFKKNGDQNIDAANTPPRNVSNGTELRSFTAKQWKGFSEKHQQEILLHYRLAYLSKTMVNWCPRLGTVLSNEEVQNGLSERGGYPVERKLMKQWTLRMTAYIERLLKSLEEIDWTDALKDMQRNWIGRSEGAMMKFHLSPGPSPKERGEIRPGYYTTDGQMWNLLQDKAKEMRSNPTQAENALWQMLRRKNTGYKIRRQQIIDRFIVDFVCLEKKLVVEVDGDIHDLQKEKDEERTSFLNERGFKVIRFLNKEIIANTDEILAIIEDELKKRPSFKKQEVLPASWREDLGGVIEVFTTRPDTIFGATFMVLAPEHELVEKITTDERRQAVEKYVKAALNRSERDRLADVKIVSGEFTGAFAIHPFTGDKIPIWVADYVLAGYGTGAIMAVPSGDQRDWNFAKHFDLQIIPVISDSDITEGANENEDGVMINSDFMNGMKIPDAIKAVIEKIKKKRNRKA
ncbi:MAG: DUF559 domain-containing protein [Bacteroidota bacterium]